MGISGQYFGVLIWRIDGWEATTYLEVSIAAKKSDGHVFYGAGFVRVHESDGMLVALLSRSRHRVNVLIARLHDVVE